MIKNFWKWWAEFELREEIGEGEAFSRWWYGLAYRRWDLNRAVGYPVPLNVVVALGRRFWLWLCWGFQPSEIDRRRGVPLLLAWCEGRTEGRRLAAEQLWAEIEASRQNEANAIQIARSEVTRERDGDYKRGWNRGWQAGASSVMDRQKMRA